jgi:hypothetical protein
MLCHIKEKEKREMGKKGKGGEKSNSFNELKFF